GHEGFLAAGERVVELQHRGDQGYRRGADGRIQGFPYRPGQFNLRSMGSAASGALRALCLASASLFLLAPAAAPAQAPLQSSLGAEVTRPQDAAQAALKAGNAARALEIADTALRTFPHDATLR